MIKNEYSQPLKNKRDIQKLKNYFYIKPISRIQAFRIIKDAVDALGFEEHISCHSLRKTFGYQAWREGTEPALLMTIFNHSSYAITKRYLCIDQDDKDQLFLKMNL